MDFSILLRSVKLAPIAFTSYLSFFILFYFLGYFSLDLLGILSNLLSWQPFVKANIVQVKVDVLYRIRQFFVVVKM
jgi:hypothetical protein